jgi:hypothetical protein
MIVIRSFLGFLKVGKEPGDRNYEERKETINEEDKTILDSARFDRLSVSYFGRSLA